MVVAGTLKADAERLSVLNNHSFLALVLVTQCADPVDRVRSLVVSLVHVIIDLESSIAAASLEVLDAA